MYGGVEGFFLLLLLFLFSVLLLLYEILRFFFILLLVNFVADGGPLTVLRLTVLGRKLCNCAVDHFLGPRTFE